VKKTLLSHGLPCTSEFVSKAKNQNVENKIVQQVEAWAKEIGERAAQARLVYAGVAPGTAQKLTSGRYPHKVSVLLDLAIKGAMAKDELAS
jgi:hypothetical protein